MAIAIDTSSASGAWNNAQSSVTWSHTCSGDNRTLVVYVTNYAKAKTVNSVTYAGTTMTQVGTRISYNNSTRWVTAWALIAPATGANNVVVTLSATDYVRTMAVSLTGTNQTTQPNANSAFASTTTGTVNQSVTTTATTWLVLGVDTNAAGSAGTGTTAINTSFGELMIYGSTTAVSAGTNSTQLTSIAGVYGGKLLAIEELATAPSRSSIINKFRRHR